MSSCLTLVNAPASTPSRTINGAAARHGQCSCSRYGFMAIQYPQQGLHRARFHSSLHLTAKRLTTAAAQAETTTTASLPALQPLNDQYDAAHSFSDFAHWIIPGHLMVGRYPFCEPSRCKSRDQGEAQVEKIIQAGVTTFICLQAELPPQEQLRIGGKDGFLPYRATAQLMAAALSGPPPTSSLHDLRTPDLDRFLPPRRQPMGEDGVGSPRKEVEFMHFGIPDLGVPTDQQYGTLDIITALEDILHNNGVAYVHCWGGRGRSGTIAACLLGKAYGLGAQEALERVDRAYRTRENEYSSPETAEQVEFVKRFLSQHAS